MTVKIYGRSWRRPPISWRFYPRSWRFYPRSWRYFKTYAFARSWVLVLSVKLETASADVKSYDPSDKDTYIEINCSFDYYVHSLHIARLHVMSYVISQVHILSDLFQNTYSLNTIILKPMSHPTCWCNKSTLSLSLGCGIDLTIALHTCCTKNYRYTAGAMQMGASAVWCCICWTEHVARCPTQTGPINWCKLKDNKRWQLNRVDALHSSSEKRMMTRLQ